MRRDPAVVELALAGAGREVRPATSNNEYLGHVMTADSVGAGARGAAERLLAGLTPRLTATGAEAAVEHASGDADAVAPVAVEPAGIAPVAAAPAGVLA